MTFSDFKKSISGDLPPAGISVYALSMWHDAQGDWEKAHEVVQDLPGKKAAWIHAYLHRKEGDSWNAGYWYDRAAKPRPTVSLADEWEQIVKELLSEA